MQEIINKLLNKTDLSREEAGKLLEGIMKEELTSIQTAMVLTALRMKGEAVEEIRGFIETLRKHMVAINAPGAVDVCGTGGDGKGTFNISTAVAFVLAGAGVKVVKHGNRAASSKCGSADVLEELGMKIDLSPEKAEEVLSKTGIVFLFAPLYHPAYKPVAIVRKELKIPTIFNYLGPFINPASVKRQLIGIANENAAGKMAEVAREMKYKHLLIVSSEDGMDEVSIFKPTTVFEVKGNSLRRFTFLPPEQFKGGSFKRIVGGDAKVNADILKAIFEGEKGERRNMVIINSAFGLFASGKAGTVDDGIEMAEKVIDEGKAKNKLEEAVEETNKISNRKSQISKTQLKTKN